LATGQLVFKVYIAKPSLKVAFVGIYSADLTYTVLHV